MIRWVVQGWIISKIAKIVRKWMIKRYSLENKFKQSFTKSHEVDWENIKELLMALEGRLQEA